MPKLQQTCENCRFLDDTYTDGNARCHRYPPQATDETHYPEDSLIITPMELHVWRFPEVDKRDWCGEWRPILQNGDVSVYAEDSGDQ